MHGGDIRAIASKGAGRHSGSRPPPCLQGGSYAQGRAATPWLESLQRVTSIARGANHTRRFFGHPQAGDHLEHRGQSKFHSRAASSRPSTALHLALDNGLQFLLGPALSLERYRQVLAAFYGLYAPLEVRLASLKTITPPLCVSLLARTRLLDQDLQALGLSSHGVQLLPLCKDLPVLVQAEHLAGCLYVVEGASLGGQVISRAVERRPGTRGDNGASYGSGSPGPDADVDPCLLEILARPDCQPWRDFLPSVAPVSSALTPAWWGARSWVLPMGGQTGPAASSPSRRGVEVQAATINTPDTDIQDPAVQC
jgi:heme oxygenase